MRNSHNFLWNFTTWHHLLSCWLVPSSLWFLYFWAKVTDLLHAAVKEEKISFQAVGFYPKKKKRSSKQSFRLTHNWLFCFHVLLQLHSSHAEVSYWGYCRNVTEWRMPFIFFIFFSDADTGQRDPQLCKAPRPLWSALVKSLDLPASETWSSCEIFFEMER